jgi:hypothetical protein
MAANSSSSSSKVILNEDIRNEEKDIDAEEEAKLADKFDVNSS